MAITKRTRFEIFKRDSFTCRYCGRKSPEVVLEIDHVIPKSKRGRDDGMNLVTSCFDCNRGKSDKNLSEIITGEDPHDKAVELLERERQLREYNHVLDKIEKRVTMDLDSILKVLPMTQHVADGIRPALYDRPLLEVWKAIKISIEKHGDYSRNCIPYFWGIMRNWRNDGPKQAD